MYKLRKVLSVPAVALLFSLTAASLAIAATSKDLDADSGQALQALYRVLSS